MYRLVNTLAISCWLLLSGFCPALAGEASDKGFVGVTGDADVLVVPDEVIVRFLVQTKNRRLPEARGEADRRTSGVLKAVTQLGVLAKHTKTDQLYIWPEYHWESGELRFYHVYRTVTVTLKESSKLEGLLASALEAGANGMQGVEFRTTELRKHRDQARLLALKAAREKAEAMAAALGRKLGKARSITEISYPSQGSGSFWWWGGTGQHVAQNVAQNVGPSPGSTGESTALGQIRVNAQVNVNFDLE